VPSRDPISLILGTRIESLKHLNNPELIVIVPTFFSSFPPPVTNASVLQTTPCHVGRNF